MHQDSEKVSARRSALKALAAATGAVTLASLPTHWSKPSVVIGAIPAHAQTSCTDWAVIIEITDESNGGAGGVGADTSPDLVEYPVYYWACGGGCLTVNVQNPSNTGTSSFLVTVFGEQIPVGPLPSFGIVIFAVNRDTLVWRSGSSIGAVDWNAVGCPPPQA